MTLSGFERRWVSVIGRAILPIGTFGGVSDQRDIAAGVAEQVAGSPWFAAIVTRLALWLVWFVPLLSRRVSRFGALGGEAQLDVLEGLFKSPSYLVRQLMTVLKLNVCMAVFGDRAVLARIGAYDLADEHSQKRAS